MNIRFSTIAFTLAMAISIQVSASQVINLMDRIEIKFVAGKARFAACRMSKCLPLGNVNGYHPNELKKKFEDANAKSGVVGQLIRSGIDGKELGNIVFAMFSGTVEHQGERYQSVWCSSNSKIEELLKLASANKRKTDYLYKVGNFSDVGCGAFVEGSPAFKEVVRQLSKALAGK